MASAPTVCNDTPPSQLPQNLFQATSPARPSFALTAPHNPMEALQSSLLTGKFSDLVVVHGARRWQAHRVVVCSQSSVLESKILNSALLNLTDYDYDSVCHAMEYFYTSSYITTDHAPDYSLPVHIQVFNLAVDFACTGLEAVAAARFRQSLQDNVTDLEVYFKSVKSIYAKTTVAHPALRVAVVEAAIMELRSLLTEPVRTRFFQITNDVPGFQADIMLALFDSPIRPLERVALELCEECGPRDENDGYKATMDCKSCGAEKTLEFY
ncbi:hypothetical protein LSUE1_G006989 [Lachnellula suecica]|uniref:BTB domain-containing protein n=1 Tax=Lachnellula suecica TaxID=602035 RepID=A0A8T9C1S7_9HELO|nr:hypothetical protein LSUE1_G006989 [Lachnellula suecica]